MRVNEIKTILKAYFEAEEGVVAVYLYGSHAMGSSNAGSDVDIAVLLEAGKAKTERLILRMRMQGDLSKLLRRDVDLALLNEIGEALSFEVLTKGTVIFEKDKNVHRFFRAVRLMQCLDFQFYQKRMQKGMVEVMKGAKIG